MSSSSIMLGLAEDVDPDIVGQYEAMSIAIQGDQQQQQKQQQQQQQQQQQETSRLPSHADYSGYEVSETKKAPIVYAVPMEDGPAEYATPQATPPTSTTAAGEDMSKAAGSTQPGGGAEPVKTPKIQADGGGKGGGGGGGSAAAVPSASAPTAVQRCPKCKAKVQQCMCNVRRSTGDMARVQQQVKCVQSTSQGPCQQLAAGKSSRCADHTCQQNQCLTAKSSKDRFCEKHAKQQQKKQQPLPVQPPPGGKQLTAYPRSDAAVVDTEA
jgi:hypothetical protein